jgi:hypothetical protein
VAFLLFCVDAVPMETKKAPIVASSKVRLLCVVIMMEERLCVSAVILIVIVILVLIGTQGCTNVVVCWTRKAPTPMTRISLVSFHEGRKQDHGTYQHHSLINISQRELRSNKQSGNDGY